ncbi:MAG: hypothetical protein O2822_06635 [Chloroflexi bacterium]|nr:hypothetical protein [Chloroflexota bacterium]
MPDVQTIAIEVAWAAVYASPWAGALLVGWWSWARIRPRSAFLAWAGATAIALGSLLVLSMALVSVIEAVTPPPILP